MEGPLGRLRWWICGLLFAATTINYIDRQVLGVLAPDLGRIIGWNEIEYGYIGLATAAYQGWSVNLFTLPSDMFHPAPIHGLAPRLEPAQTRELL
jgi:hypothetical protein